MEVKLETMNKQSLREIKKEATAHALAEAAFQLTLERGLDGFVVEDVVGRAGYSRRTFTNHYSCKEEAVAVAVFPFHGIEEITDVITDLPDNTTPLDVMYHFAKMQLAEGIIRKMRQLMTLTKEYPSLRPYTLTVFHHLQTGAQELLNDLFHERYPPGYTHTLAGAVCAAILPLLDGSLNVLLPDQSPEEAPDAIPLSQYLDTIFGYLRNGL